MAYASILHRNSGHRVFWSGRIQYTHLYSHHLLSQMRELSKYEVPSTGRLVWHYTYLDKYTNFKMEEGFNSMKQIEDEGI